MIAADACEPLRALGPCASTNAAVPGYVRATVYANGELKVRQTIQTALICWVFEA